MADKYIIQIQPQVSPADGQKMENDLNKRFGNIANKFGSHLRNTINTSLKASAVLSAGLMAGVTAALLTNPFEKINEDLNATLDRFDDIAVRGAEFGVSSGKYFQAQTVAKSLGVEDFSMILARYNSKLDAARVKTPGGKPEDDYLKNFTKDKDILASFSAFSETLRNMKPEDRNFAVEQVFGTKLGLRLAEVLQTNLGQRRQQIFGNQTSGQLNSPIEHISNMEDIQKLNRARQDVSELWQKSQAINPGVIAAQNQVEKARMAKDVMQLSQYEVFAKLSESQAQIAGSLEGIRSDITQVVAPKIIKFVDDFKTVKDFVVKKFSKKEGGFFR
jgi:hypothetical protein